MTELEVKDLIASLGEQNKKTEALIAENARLAEARHAKAEALTAENARLAKTRHAKYEAEFNEHHAKVMIEHAEGKKRLKKAERLLGGIGNNQGSVAEEFYFNSLKADPVLNGMRFDFIDKNVTRSNGTIEDEYDIIMVNGKDIFIIEVKYKAHPNDLKQLLNHKHPNFKLLYPEYQNYQHHLGLASFYISDDLKQDALNNGVSLLQRNGTVIETNAAPSVDNG